MSTVLKISDHEFKISGILDFDNAQSLYVKASRYLSQGQQIVADLAAVTSSDSAGVAMLVTLLKDAQKKQCRLRYINMPDSIMAVAKVSGVAALLN